MSNDPQAITDLFANVSLGGPQNAVGFVMWRVVHRYQREVDRALVPLDLTHLQFTTLAMAAWQGRSGEWATQSELARFGDIQPMQISHMLKSLESKGMVARRRSSSDARAKRIEVTAAGLNALRRALPAVITVQREFFGDEMSPDSSLSAILLRLDNTS